MKGNNLLLLFRECFFVSLLFMLVKCTSSPKHEDGANAVSAISEETSTESSSISTDNTLEVSNKKLFLSPLDYAKYVENPVNGLKVSKTMEGINFSAQYKPLDYVIVKQAKQLRLPQSKYDSLYNKYEGMTYYVMSLSLDKAGQQILKYKLGGTDTYSNRVKYFSFHVEKDISVIQGEEVLKPAMCHFERDYGVSSELKLLLAFSGVDETKDATLRYEDNIFGLGRIKLKIKEENIANIPLVKIGYKR